MTKEQLNVAMAMLDAHAEERRRQHAEISDKLDLVTRNTRRDIYVWVVIVSLFSVITVETVISLIN
jgi:hypothetical protein